MSLWLDVLRLGAEGRSADARYLIATDLRLSLCRYATTGAGYDGPLPQAVRRFATKLPTGQRNQLLSFETEFVELLLDESLLGIAKPLRLIDHCLADPTPDFELLVARFPWDPNLKRSREWKANWIADTLRSLARHGIPLPPATLIALADRGEARYDFNELAWAIAPGRLEKAWRSYCDRLGPLARSLSIVDEPGGAGIGDESIDYGVISMAELACQLLVTPDPELAIDLDRLAVTVSAEIATLLADLQIQHPRDCYHPVAWHNVFWKIVSDYDGLSLELETREPAIDSDAGLVDHLRTNYSTLDPVSRPTVNRRRQRLTSLCQDSIFTALRKIFDLDREQRAIPITQ